MPHHRLGRTAASALLAVLFASTSPAHAQDDPPPADTTTVWEDTTLIVTAATPATLALTETPGTPYDGPVIRCAWFELRIQGVALIAVQVADPITGTTYLFHCWFSHPWADRHPAYPIAAVYDPVVDPPGPLVTTPVAARFALDSIEFERPEIVTSPAGPHVVGVPSWFAVGSELDYRSASAQAGPVWATVRPVFRDVTWRLGDGKHITCTADATTRWDPDGPDTQTSSCRHTYESTHAEIGAAEATVSWTVWQRTDRTAGAWEVWGTVRLTTAADIDVLDLQAVID